MKVAEKGMEKTRSDIENKRVAFLTLGCKVNAYETEAMQTLLLRAGAVPAEFDETADIYIVNTCSVTNIADRKSRQMLHRARKKNPEAVIVAAGCYVQTADEEALKETGIDVIVGNNQKKEIVAILEGFFNGRKNERPDIGKETEYEDLNLDTRVEHTRAYIKIQDGCNQFCSYCIIPYARGRIRSRRAEDVVAEVTRLAEAGYQEVVLTGIHLSSYGQPAAEGEEPLPALIRRLDAVPGIQRIRLGSLEPRIITEEFVKTLVSCKKVCPHFHLSLQSGSDTVLQRMNRKYLTKEYAESAAILKKYYEAPAITTDIIVGFPQETDAEFEETLAFAEKIGFSKIHVFKYSRRHGTVADKMSGQIPEPVKTERSERLLALEKRLGETYRRELLHTVQRVLFEEGTVIDGRPHQVGYTERYVRIAVETKEDLANRIKATMVTGKAKEEETLLGELI